MIYEIEYKGNIFLCSFNKSSILVHRKDNPAYSNGPIYDYEIEECRLFPYYNKYLDKELKDNIELYREVLIKFKKLQALI
jgi:hypothetical protein